VYKQILINARLKTGKGGQETELTGRSPLRRQRTAPDWQKYSAPLMILSSHHKPELS
jgi:hypothetical protein